MSLHHDDFVNALKRVRSIVAHHLPRWYDIDSIAVDILLESWDNDVEKPSWGFIVQRCIDQVRAHDREHGHLQQYQPAENHDISVDLLDQVNEIMKILNPLERKVVFYRFYLELSIADTAKRLRMDVNVVRETLTQAIFKMKQLTWE